MPGTETRQTTDLISARFTPDEAGAVRAAAASRGLPPSTFLRSVALRAAGRAAPAVRRRAASSASLSDEDRALLREVLGALGRLGNNANQLARAANAGEGFDRVAVGRLVADLAAIHGRVMGMAEGPSP